MNKIFLFLLVVSFGLSAENSNKKIDLWDFMGIWKYSESESLNISKDPKYSKITIQYNAKSDGFEDRFFDKCEFQNGVIYADFRGGERNVKIEIKEGNLVLTISPFHQFKPIIKQTFKRYHSYVLKYSISKNDTFILDGEKKEKHIPAGKRISLKHKEVTPGHLSVHCYKGLFYNYKLPIDKYKKIETNKLHDIKPIFISEDSNNLNKSEQWIKKMYNSQQLEENTFIVKYTEQNIKGQKKIHVNKSLFSKLNLQLIRNIPYYDIYITGTVDLSPNFKSIVIDFQSENEYTTCLVNYSKQGKYIDHIVIGYNDYVHGAIPKSAFFGSQEIFVDSKKYTDNSGYRTYNLKRYIINKSGEFIASNYGKSYSQNTNNSFQITSQDINSNTYGSGNLQLHLNYSNSSKGDYATSMHAKIIYDNGLEKTIPFDLSALCGFFYPLYGSYIKPQTELQYLLVQIPSDYYPFRLKINFHLMDLNNDGKEELILQIINKNFVTEPSEYTLFTLEGGVWVYNEYSHKANDDIRKYNLPFKSVFSSYLNTNEAPFYFAVNSSKKKDLLLNENEELIYTFLIKNSAKRMCLGVDKNKKYMFYRFGKVGKVEFEYRVKQNSTDKKFEYYRNNQMGRAPRNDMEYVNFFNENYQYSIYNNYLEIDIDKYDEVLSKYSNQTKNEFWTSIYYDKSFTEDDSHKLGYILDVLKYTNKVPGKYGQGIMVRNIKTNKKTFLPADESSIKGFLGFSKYGALMTGL
ncbi:hypothetical protein OAX11_02150 [Flavobacteriaceae bacterium]|nr:hypothetical protein [Flavobacteriaceae bacterium]